MGSLEAIVAFTLLTSVLSLLLPLAVRHGRLLMEQRDYRIALDELSNHLDRLSSLPEKDIQIALGELSPAAFVAARLSGAKLNGTFEPADYGGRVMLQLSWGKTPRLTIAMASWTVPTSQNSNQESSQEALP